MPGICSTSSTSLLRQLEWALVSYNASHISIESSTLDALNTAPNKTPGPFGVDRVAALIGDIVRGDLDKALQSAIALALFNPGHTSVCCSVDAESEPLEYANGSADELAWITERRKMSAFFARRIAAIQHAIEGQNQHEGGQIALLGCLAVGVACLNAYIQNNFTGPDLTVAPQDLLPALPSESCDLRTLALETLSADNEEAYHLCEHPEYLMFAKCLLVDNKDAFVSLKVCSLLNSCVLT